MVTDAPPGEAEPSDRRDSEEREEAPEPVGALMARGLRRA
jgi:hypothetical protein